MVASASTGACTVARLRPAATGCGSWRTTRPASPRRRVWPGSASCADRRPCLRVAGEHAVEGAAGVLEELLDLAELLLRAGLGDLHRGCGERLQRLAHLADLAGRAFAD